MEKNRRKKLIKNLITNSIVALIIALIPNVSICQTNNPNCFDGKKLILSEKEWKERLTPKQFQTLRKRKTEPAFEGAYVNTKQKGIYECAGCFLPLFSSEEKYESGSGWPSFWAPICTENVTLKNKFFTSAKVVLCSRCEGYLGEVFKDGPPPTGERYCINSVALKFVKAKK